MKLECKCHGVSGSCSLRTCWLAMSDFRRTGDYLRKKYNTAIEVTMNQDGTGFMVADRDFKGSTRNELVYVENSPDYCLMDRASGEWRIEVGWQTGFLEELGAARCIDTLSVNRIKIGHNIITSITESMHVCQIKIQAIWPLCFFTFELQWSQRVSSSRQWKFWCIPSVCATL